MNCLVCNKESGHANYGSWSCHIEAAKKLGGIEHTPNGLPIRAIITADSRECDI